MKAAFENLPANFMCRDNAGMILNISGAAAELIGKSREQVIGCHLSELIGEDAAEQTLADDRILFEGGQDHLEKS